METLKKILDIIIKILNSFEETKVENQEKNKIKIDQKNTAEKISEQKINELDKKPDPDNFFND